MSSVSQLQFSTEHATAKLPSCMVSCSIPAWMNETWNETWAFVHECSVTSVTSNSLQPHGLQPTRLLCPWDSPGKNTSVGRHALLQELNLRLPHCRLILYHWATEEALWAFATPQSLLQISLIFSWLQPLVLHDASNSKVLLKFSGAQREGREMWFVSLKCSLQHPNYHFQFPGMILTLTTSVHFHN